MIDWFRNLTQRALRTLDKHCFGQTCVGLKASFWEFSFASLAPFA